jgi:hypothetical protein
VAVRTPLEIARLLGWPEAQRPKLIVWRSRPGVRCWLVGHRFGRNGIEESGHGGGSARTHAEALAVGLAALETASVRSKA